MMKKALILSATIFLSSCGFQSVHSATKLSDDANLRSVKVELVEPERVNEREGSYYLQQHLFDRLGQNTGPHVLKIEPKVRRRPYGLTSNDIASRYDYVMSVRYELVDSKTGDTLIKDQITATTTFGSSRDPYARISSEKSAAEQVSRDAADRIIVRLASYYKNPERYARMEEEKLRERIENQISQDDEAPVETLDQP